MELSFFNLFSVDAMDTMDTVDAMDTMDTVGAMDTMDTVGAIDTFKISNLKSQISNLTTHYSRLKRYIPSKIKTVRYITDSFYKNIFIRK